MLADYKGNEVRADQTYKGKRLRISGTVTEIKKSFTDSIYIIMGTGRGMFEIPAAQCSFGDESTGHAASLNKGEQVTVECDCDGLLMHASSNPIGLCERFDRLKGEIRFPLFDLDQVSLVDSRLFCGVDLREPEFESQSAKLRAYFTAQPAPWAPRRSAVGGFAHRAGVLDRA